MSEEILPFSRPTISRAAIDDVVSCLESGWITTGPKVAAFTEGFEGVFRRAICVADCFGNGWVTSDFIGNGHSAW